MLYAPIRFFIWFWAALKQWHYRNRPPPRVVVPGADPLGNAPGEHNTHFVSRHDIAECGLSCPNCRKTAAHRGDFSVVCLDQRDNEVVHCGSCGAWLIASPDTEHGDDLLPYKHCLFHRFVRRSRADVLRDQYGEDIQSADNAAVSANRLRLGEATLERMATDPSHKNPIV